MLGLSLSFLYMSGLVITPVVEKLVQVTFYRCKDASNQGFMVYDYKLRGMELENTRDGRIFYINYCIRQGDNNES